jgi:hypothetical protein
MSTPQTFRQFRTKNLSEGFSVICGVVLLLAVAGSLLVFAGKLENHNKEATQRASLANTLLSEPSFVRHDSPAMHREREKVLEQITTLRLHGVIEIPYISSSEEQRLFHDNTGAPVHLSTYHQHWSAYPYQWLPWVALGTTLFLLNLMLFFYSLGCLATGSSERHIPLVAGLSWHKPWAWAFVLSTSLPIGWLFWLVSYIRLRQRQIELASPQTP